MSASPATLLASFAPAAAGGSRRRRIDRDNNAAGLRGQSSRDALSLRALRTSRSGCFSSCRAGRTVCLAADRSDAAPHIVWLRAGDLRTHDHPALTAAGAMTGGPRTAIPVFVFDPKECALMTPATLRVVHETVSELRGTLRSLGGDLFVRVGDPAEELPKLAAAVGASSAAMHAELEWPRLKTYRSTIAALQTQNVVCDEWSAGLREPTEEGIASAMRAAETARTVKGAPLCAFKNDSAFVAESGSLIPPLPKPESMPSVPEEVANGGEAGQGSGTWTRGELPPLETVRGWATLPDNETDKAYDDAVAAAYTALNDPELVKRRKGVASVDNAFVMFSEEKMLALAAEEASVAIPPVPFRLPGGETAAIEFFDAFLDFYTATSNKEYQRLYDRVLENKPGAFFRLFGAALALGTISPRHVYSTAREWEAKSKRATDLCANARNIAEARDYQQAVAAAALAAGAEGPGLPLVGAYNVVMGTL